MFVTAEKYTEGSFVITESLLPKVIKIAIVNQFHAYRGLLYDNNIVKEILMFGSLPLQLLSLKLSPGAIRTIPDKEQSV